jgi:hypothetical protein
MNRAFPAITASIALALSSLPTTAAAAVNPGEAEAQKCEERIAQVQRDVLGKYEDALGDLQNNLQKVADLEGALTVRAERERLKKEGTLTEKNYVAEPKSLRQLQIQQVSKMQELIAQLVADTVPKLVEFKKSLTVAGRLDDAVTVRTAIEKLQNNYVPVSRPEAGSVVPAETLIIAFAGDRTRADKTYKGQRITVHGVVGGYRPDPADPKFYHVYLTGGSGNGWVQCAFSTGEFRIREEKGSFGAVTLVISSKDGDKEHARIQKGQTMDIRGVCEGLDETVRLARCDVPR